MGFGFDFFLFLQKLYSYREVKQFPDFRQIADHPAPGGSRAGARRGQSGQARAAPSWAVWTESRRRRETQVLTPRGPCVHRISPTIPPPCPPAIPTPRRERGSEWPKHTLTPKPEPCSVPNLKLKKKKKKEQREGLPSQLPLHNYKLLKKPTDGMKRDVRGWGEPCKAIWFEGFAPVCLSYKRKPEQNNEG